MVKILLLLSFIFSLSCGKKISDKEEGENQEGSAPDGTYSAVLVPVNYRISSQVHGDVRVHKYGDEFKVSVNLRGSPKGLLRQHLQTGSGCPRIEHDINGDGYIDSYESKFVSGSSIVPLDGDLSTQTGGYTYILTGNYRYSRSTSYYLMLADLHLPDEVSNDSMVKLPDNELPLERRVVVIYSLKANRPPSATGEDMPVACGILTRISDRPVPDDSTWNESEPPERPRREPRRPRPQPGPHTEPRIPPPERGPEEGETWWSRWRDRWRDWWFGNENAM